FPGPIHQRRTPGVTNLQFCRSGRLRVSLSNRSEMGNPYPSHRILASRSGKTTIGELSARREAFTQRSEVDLLHPRCGSNACGADFLSNLASPSREEGRPRRRLL